MVATGRSLWAFAEYLPSPFSLLVCWIPELIVQGRVKGWEAGRWRQG